MSTFFLESCEHMCAHQQQTKEWFTKSSLVDQRLYYQEHRKLTNSCTTEEKLPSQPPLTLGRGGAAHEVLHVASERVPWVLPGVACEPSLGSVSVSDLVRALCKSSQCLDFQSCSDGVPQQACVVSAKLQPHHWFLCFWLWAPGAGPAGYCFCSSPSWFWFWF